MIFLIELIIVFDFEMRKMSESNAKLCLRFSVDDNNQNHFTFILIRRTRISLTL